jgi:hypothetical protein
VSNEAKIHESAEEQQKANKLRIEFNIILALRKNLEKGHSITIWFAVLYLKSYPKNSPSMKSQKRRWKGFLYFTISSTNQTVTRHIT